MGNWAIVITGTGAHNNKDYPGDADRIMKKTVKELQDAGHFIGYASITAGGRETVIGGEEVSPPCCGTEPAYCGS